MSGKLVASIIVGVTLVFGAVLYWVQVYAYYDRLDPSAVELTMVNMATGEPEVIAADDLKAIDGTSSPIRFRACFTAPLSDTVMSETYEMYADPTPLNAPGWFDCFNSVEIGEALEQGRAMAFLSEKEVADGVDRVIAVMPDGQAYAWHQLNEKYQEDGDEFID
ncbi:MAG TPA: histidine kinase [Maritimibacter sp.]|nr:histidine kinase [Maritimibacter sp.]